MIVLVGAAVALLSGGLAHADMNKRHPALRLADSVHLDVRGTGFKPHERVRVIASARIRETRRVVAGAAGRFSARFAQLDSSDCFGLTVTAVGSEGSRARLKLPSGECASP